MFAFDQKTFDQVWGRCHRRDWTGWALRFPNGSRTMCSVAKALRDSARLTARTNIVLKSWARLRTFSPYFSVRRAAALARSGRSFAVNRPGNFPALTWRALNFFHGVQLAASHSLAVFTYWSVHGALRHDDNQGAREVSHLGGSRYGYRRRPILRGQRNLRGVCYSAGQSATISSPSLLAPRADCLIAALHFGKKRLPLYRNQESLDWRERNGVVRPCL